MINDLRYAVSFPTNGVSLSGSLSFQPGSTAISGPNGAGKSFIAEMIRYGLFGKKALRGPASDYKTLDMELFFNIGPASYRVIRGKKEQLIDEELEQLAVGADAVNKKIVEILGFDLEVFDVVCAANQKESERLTRLTPARRKELIDDVVGLTATETVEKACKEEARAARIEAETLTRQLVLPVEPEKPKGYRPAAEIKKELDETISILAERVKLQRIIDSVPPEPMKPPKPCPDIEELEAHEKERIHQEAQFAALHRELANLPAPTVTEEQIREAEALATYDALVAIRGRKPEYTAEQVDHFEAVLNAQSKAGEEATCPNCQHTFHVGLSAEEEALAVEHSPLNRLGIQNERRAIESWAEPLEEPKGTRLSAQEVAEARMALANQVRRNGVLAELKELSNNLLPDQSGLLEEARQLLTAWEIYDHQLGHYAAGVAAAQAAQTELAKLSVPVSTPEDLNHDYTEARIYEERLVDYDIAKERFEQLTAEIAEAQERADAFMAGAKGLVEARRTLKAFLAPSLSRVASKIIQEMTENSQRPLYSILIDEDMNITADGQDVSTFNGAHATMINLALRLALGQVLVARVFPVFIGDEIDSDADAGNSQAIADALSACKEQLKQIILISHKRLEGVDHEVML